MNQSTVNKSPAKNACKHKAGDNWEKGCCGQDSLAQKSVGNFEEQKKDSINTIRGEISEPDFCRHLTLEKLA